MGRLSTKQVEWLNEAERRGGVPPLYGWGAVASSMVRKGFAIRQIDLLTRSDRYKITDAGRAALKGGSNG